MSVQICALIPVRITLTPSKRDLLLLSRVMFEIVCSGVQASVKIDIGVISVLKREMKQGVQCACSLYEHNASGPNLKNS